MISKILLRGGRVLCPRSGIDHVADLLVVGDHIAQLDGRIERPPADAQIVDVRGLCVSPGFLDLHVHLREPGQEYKEDIASGTRAAAAGGFTSVCCMPNTQPVNDTRAVTELMLRRAREVGAVRVYPIGAISQGQRGEQLAEMAELKDAGCVAVSDDGRPVMNGELMRRALEYARTLDLTVIQHAEDLHLAAGGVMNEGPAATRAGLRGQPSCAESAMVARDLELVAYTGARYHLAHISTAASLRAIREAKRRGLPVTCEVTPHHLTLTDVACCGYDANTKVAPPLRSDADREALWEGLVDGTIDCVATDHAPHALQEKQLEFDHAAFGMVGLETALPLLLGGARGRLPLLTLIDRLTAGPARVLGLPGGALTIGGPADIAVFDPERRWTVSAESLHSRSKNSPFLGDTLSGRVLWTLCRGRVVHDELSGGGR